MPAKKCPFLNDVCIKHRCALWKDSQYAIPKIIDSVDALYDQLEDVRQALEKK